MDRPLTGSEQLPGAADTPETRAFLRVLAKMRRNMPADMTPEQIDASVDATKEELRRERRARRRSCQYLGVGRAESRRAGRQNHNRSDG